MVSLSVIIPVRNEEASITKVLDQLLAQHYEPDQLEIIVVDGLSTDATPQIVQQYAQKHVQIRYVENPKRLASAARNIGIHHAKGEAVLIVDGHCIIDSNEMLLRVDEAFAKSGADCLGRPQPLEMNNATPLQWAIATARRSPLGHHPDSFIYSGQARFSPASSVAVAYRKSVFEKVGTFDESFDACEDVEMNTRIDAAGLTCYFDPAIAVRYVPRESLKALETQMNRYGRGRVRLWRKHRHTFSFKSFAPGLFVFWVLLTLPALVPPVIATLFPEVLGTFLSNVFFVLPSIFVGVLIPYALIIVAESTRLAITQKRWGLFPVLPHVFIAIHFGFGWGVLRELFFSKR